jgi:hypothetical protein
MLTYCKVTLHKEEKLLGMRGRFCVTELLINLETSCPKPPP